MEEQRTTRATTTKFKVDYDESICDKKLYTDVLEGIARNCKKGPFKATSGIVIPCKYCTLKFIEIHNYIQMNTLDDQLT